MKIENISTIYKITNPVGGIYIGQSIDWSSRFKRYSMLHCKSQKLLYASIKRYGWKNHKIELLEHCDVDDINKKEIFYISKYNSWYKLNDKGLNIHKGGKGSSTSGKWSEEAKKKISILRKGRKVNQNTKDAVSRTHKGKKQSEKWKEIISSIKSISILQYSKNGDFIKEWKSATAAAKELKLQQSCINSCVLGKKSSAGGFQWKYKSENYPLKIDELPGRINARIKVTYLDTLEFQLFDNIKQMSEQLNIWNTIIYTSLRENKGILKKRNIKIERILD